MRIELQIHYIEVGCSTKNLVAAQIALQTSTAADCIDFGTSVLAFSTD